MAKKCRISGKKGQYGNRVSHAKNRTPHKFEPNLIKKRLFVPELNKKVTVKISTRMLRTIDKIGLPKACKKYGVKLESLMA